MAPAKIVIVEDELIVALDIEQQLRDLGYSVAGLASSGEEAIRCVRETEPDLVLMDIRLRGDRDGVETAEILRRQWGTSVIYLTAHADTETLSRAKLTDPYGYVVKPFKTRDLHIAIEIGLVKREMEKRERKVARQLRQVIQTVPDGIVLLDADRRIVSANPKAQEFLAVLTGDPVGSVLNCLGEFPADALLAPGKALALHSIAVETPAARVFELRSTPVEDFEGGERAAQDGGWVLTIRDVTEEQKAQQYLQQQERLAAVGQLAAGIAHDFDNILATIILSAQIIPRIQELSAKSAEHLDRMIAQSRHASALIGQLLDFSRRSVFERTTMDLIPLYREWTRLLEQLMPENVNLRLSVPPQPCIVCADPTRMQQVLVNLVVNARDALPQGGDIRIELENILLPDGEPGPLPGMPPGSWVRVRLTDNGTGIPPETLPHIFEPFFTTKSPDRGNGLGLAQVYGIVQQHDGFIDVASTVGVGTTFTLYLPGASAHRP